MSNVFYTADSHFGHANILKYCKRPFKNIDEHDEALIENWNATVGADDTVYHLGDFSFRSPDKWLSRLNGIIHIIWGNHDKQCQTYYRHVRRSGIPSLSNFASAYNMREIRVNGQKITLCHYAMRVWNCSHHNAWQLYGHSHAALPPQDISSGDHHGSVSSRQLDVGVDNAALLLGSYRPFSHEEVKQYMESR